MNRETCPFHPSQPRDACADCAHAYRLMQARELILQAGYVWCEKRRGYVKPEDSQQSQAERS